MNGVVKEYTGRVIHVEKYASQDNELVQGIKRENQGYYDCSRRYAGGNGTYLKFGEYHGMRLEVIYSLYDTDKKLIELNGKKYCLPKHITVEIYQRVMDLLGKKRMPASSYEFFLNMEGQKKQLFVCVVEETLQEMDGYVMVDIVCALPVQISGQVVASTQKISLREVA